MGVLVNIGVDDCNEHIFKEIPRRDLNAEAEEVPQEGADDDVI